MHASCLQALLTLVDTSHARQHSGMAGGTTELRNTLTERAARELRGRFFACRGKITFLASRTRLPRKANDLLGKKGHDGGGRVNIEQVCEEQPFIPTLSIKGTRGRHQ